MKKTKKYARNTAKSPKKNNYLPDYLSYGVIGIFFIFFLIFISNINRQNNEIRQLEESRIYNSHLRIKTPTNNEKVVALVEKASKYVENNPQQAFSAFRTPNSEYWQEESYIFVYDMEGKTIVLPPEPKLEGTSRLAAKDKKGVYYVKEMINILKSKDTGWLQYSYPKPQETIPSTKFSYFKKVKIGNSYVVVGSGYYLK